MQSMLGTDIVVVVAKFGIQRPCGSGDIFLICHVIPQDHVWELLAVCLHLSKFGGHMH